jgi:hypothetical protein
MIDTLHFMKIVKIPQITGVKIPQITGVKIPGEVLKIIHFNHAYQ